MDRARMPALAVTGASVLIGALYVVRRIALSLSSPRVVHEPLEGAAYLSMLAWRQGGWSGMYPPGYETSGEPLVITPYPPMFHALWRLTAVVLGEGASYTPGRIVANLALAGIVILIYACARNRGARRLTAGVFSILFLLPVPVALWAGVARVDVPGIALSLVGLWLYLRHRDDVRWSRFLLCAVPIVLAGWTKQSLIAVPAAIVFAEILARRYRKAGVFAAATAGPVLAGFVFLNIMTDGGFFDATVTSLADEFFFVAGLSVAADFLVTNPLMLILVLLTLSLLRFADHHDAVLLLFAATALGVLALTIGKPGANVNYFIEPIAALCICAAVGLERWQVHRSWRGAVTVAVAGIILWSVVTLIPGYHAAYRSQRAVIARSGTITLPPEALAGPVLFPASLTLLMEPQPQYYVNDSYTVAIVAAWGELMTTERIVDDLRQQRVGAVLVRPEEFQQREGPPNFVGDWQRGWNFWSVDEFREALLAAYAPVQREFPLGVVLLLPKNSDAIPSDIPESSR